MVYITLDELKEILPDILDQWIDEDDESWEWIFQEIEQKCHIGKKFKSKKRKKKLRDDVDELTRKVDVIMPQLIADLNSRVDELRKYTTDNLSSRINRLSNDIEAAKSMAQTAKQRTEVDYSSISYSVNEKQAIQNVYNRMTNRGATRDELDNFRHLIKKYDATNYKPPVKDCTTCKHSENVNGCAFADSCKNCSDWEAKNDE